MKTRLFFFLHFASKTSSSSTSIIHFHIQFTFIFTYESSFFTMESPPLQSTRYQGTAFRGKAIRGTARRGTHSRSSRHPHPHNRISKSVTKSTTMKGELQPARQISTEKESEDVRLAMQRERDSVPRMVKQEDCTRDMASTPTFHVPQTIK